MLFGFWDGFTVALIVVGEVCAEVEGLLMAMAVVVVVIGSDLGCGVVLEVRIALSYDKRLAVVTPTEAVEQLDASLVKTGTGSQVVRSLVSQQTVTCIGIQEECVLCGECVQCPALIVKLFVMDRDIKTELPWRIGHRDAVKLHLVCSRLADREPGRTYNVRMRQSCPAERLDHIFRWESAMD